MNNYTFQPIPAKYCYFRNMKRIVIAPDSFKECLPAREVAASMAQAARSRWPDFEVVELPLADGGEGTLDVLAAALEAELRWADVHDPLGRPVQARYAVKGEAAVIETAQAVGLNLLAPSERNPLKASSRGLGELLLQAWQDGCRHFIIGLGGTATCDGGKGMLEVSGIEALKGARFELLSDVDAPFVGPRGAARVFAPQKGATLRDVEVLEQQMLAQAKNLFRETGVDVADLPGAGAAGGLGGAFIAFFGARLYPGIDRILDLVHFEEQLIGASLVITGEGKSDTQTLMGKVPYGVLLRVRKAGRGIPAALLSGRIEDRAVLARAGFGPIVEVSPRDLPLRAALAPETTRRNLLHAVSTLPPTCVGDANYAKSAQNA